MKRETGIGSLDCLGGAIETSRFWRLGKLVCTVLGYQVIELACE